MRTANICYFDFETTGLELDSKIVSASFKLYSGKSLKHDYYEIINPGENVSVEASNIHGISNFDGVEEFSMRHYNIIYSIISRSEYLAGYNIINYDLDILLNACKRLSNECFQEMELLLLNKKIIDLCYVSRLVHPNLVPKTLEAVYTFLKKKTFKAHNAEEDVKACTAILKVYDKFYDLENYVLSSKERKSLFGSSIDDRFTFGKHIGKSIVEVYNNHKGYIEWAEKAGIIKISDTVKNEL